MAFSLALLATAAIDPNPIFDAAAHEDRRDDRQRHPSARASSMCAAAAILQGLCIAPPAQF